jgi:hypothetical protein
MENYLVRIFYALKLTKAFRVMRLSTFLLFLFLAQLHAGTISSQLAIVQINNNSLTIKELISEIEQQTDYLFIFSRNDIDANHRVTIRTDSRNVSDILYDVFRESDITYSFGNNYISLRKKITDTRQLPSMPQQEQNQITVTGVVADNAGPVIGANVVEKGTTNGTVTNIDGEFSLNVSPNAVLVITYIGYVEQQIPVNGKV